MTVCARDGCDRHARGDEFCSVYCCKVSAGVVTEEEDRTEKREAKRRAEEIRIDADNTRVNRERHEGPHRRQNVRRVS